MKEIIVQLGNEVALTSDDISKAINGLTNQDSGFMSLKSVCQKENLNTNGVFAWLREKGWLEAWPEVTTKAVIDWGSVNSFTNTLTIKPTEVLIMIIGYSHYVNTNSLHYTSFIHALNEAKLEAGYNRQVKQAKPQLTDLQKRTIRAQGYRISFKY